MITNFARMVHHIWFKRAKGVLSHLMNPNNAEDTKRTRKGSLTEAI